MQTETVDYRDGEVTLRGYLVYDETLPEKRPGVLVMPGGFGLGRNAKGRTEMLSRMGYVALAGDPYGGGIEIDDLKEVMKQVTDLRADTAKFRRRAKVALDRLIAMPQVDPSRVAAIGYCLGGTFVLELARDGAPLAGVVTFHGGLETKSPATPGMVTAKLLILTGADDPTVPVTAERNTASLIRTRPRARSTGSSTTSSLTNDHGGQCSHSSMRSSTMHELCR